MKGILLIISIGFVLGCSSDSYDPASDNCEGADCTQSSTGAHPVDSGSASGRNPASVSTPISVGSSSSSSNSSSTGSGGFGNSGASSGSSNSDASGSNGSTDPNRSTLQYNSPGGYASYFSKIHEPMDSQTHVGLPFTLKFSAVGRIPLKYTWYKVTANGDQKLADDLSILSRSSAATSDDGIYYATVEDSDGNILTSRKVRLKVNPERKACSAGEYGPYKISSNEYNYSFVVPRSEVPNGSGARYVQLPQEVDGYAVAVSRCVKYKGTGNCKSGNSTLLQCQNGKYAVISTNCRLWQDNSDSGCF